MQIRFPNAMILIVAIKLKIFKYKSKLTSTYNSIFEQTIVLSIIVNRNIIRFLFNKSGRDVNLLLVYIQYG